MSKYVDQIIQDLADNPASWTEYDGWGVKKDNMQIWGYNKSILLPTLNLRINGSDMPTTWSDSVNLTKAVRKWYAEASMNMITKQQPSP